MSQIGNSLFDAPGSEKVAALLEKAKKNNVKVVIRLNNPLYDKSHFEERSIQHVEMYFDDGTNPTDEIVRKFIQISDEIVEQGGAGIAAAQILGQSRRHVGPDHRRRRWRGRRAAATPPRSPTGGGAASVPRPPPTRSRPGSTASSGSPSAARAPRCRTRPRCP